MIDQEKIRNIAVIAHIDHGKTTLLDSLLKQSDVFHSGEAVPERVMDSYDQEQERGITIFAKHTSIRYGDYKLNIIDTPGHADFAGEVERVLGMVDSVLLLVDAKEGPMPQTRFVLMKSLQMGIKPIVVLNKMDRPHADHERALNLTFDLFAELGATDEQLDFAHCYASGLNGFAVLEPEDEKVDMKPMIELIIEKVPPRKGNTEDPFLMRVATIDYNDYVGRQGCGRVMAGVVKKGMTIEHTNFAGEKKNGKVQRLEVHEGLNKVEVDSAGVGEIVTISGIEDVTIGDSLADPANTVTLPPIPMEEPTLSVDIMVNSGPFVGKDGKHVTMNKIKERLAKEKVANPTLKIDMSDQVDKVTVSGRGELHLTVLIEAMRRESFEMIISQPQVITKVEDGVKCEPIEKVHIEVPTEFVGAVMQEIGERKGEMQSLHTNEYDITSLEFLMPTRGLIGCNSELLTLTKGLAIVTSIFDHYGPWKGEIPGRKNGALVSICSGSTNGYACFTLQSRGTLFVKPGDEVYEGMIVGENSRDNDLVVNVTKAKQLNNIRSAGKDESIILTPPKSLTLERSIDYIESDEYVEVTPKHIRLRKQYLTEVERKRFGRKK